MDLIILLILSSILYFLPYYIALGMKSKYRTFILVMDIFLGWTVVVWLVLFVLAFLGSERSFERKRYPPSLSLTSSVEKEDALGTEKDFLRIMLSMFPSILSRYLDGDPNEQNKIREWFCSFDVDHSKRDQ